MENKLKALALQSGLFEIGRVEMDKVKIYPELRKACEENKCRKFGTSWTCPPGVGTLEECTERLKQYDNMLLFSHKALLDDEFDIEGMAQGVIDFKDRVSAFEKEASGLLKNYMFLTNEGCLKCEKCTYPLAPCRYPEKIHHSISGYGLFVSRLAQEAKIKYNNGPLTVTYLGALLY